MIQYYSLMLINQFVVLFKLSVFRAHFIPIVAVYQGLTRNDNINMFIDDFDIG